MAAVDPHHAQRQSVELRDGAVVRIKPGMQGYPALPEGAAELAPYVRDVAGDLAADTPIVIDASGSAGALGEVAYSAAARGVQLHVFEPSAAALTCAQESHAGKAWVELEAGVVWDAWKTYQDRSVDLVILLPPSDRGSERVRAELASAVALVGSHGRLVVALHKDRGGKRYLKEAQAMFDSVATVGRVKGWRIAVASGGHGPGEREQGWGTPFDAVGCTFWALPGVFAAGKIDPGTRVLLDVLEERRVGSDLAGASVLDLGCGYGALSVWAARAGAIPTGVDDDFAAIRSTRRNAAANDVQLNAVHSDLDAGLPPEAVFDVVLCNPPFHVGKQVRMDLSQAFVRAAHRRLTPGGVLWLVANRALPYETYLDGWTAVDTVSVVGGFKVIRAER